MAWVRPTLSTIITRMEADCKSLVTGNVALLRRALLKILIRVFALAVHTAYGYVEWAVKQIFVRTAEKEYLDLRAEEYGVTRKKGAFATGYILLSGVNGTFLPKGTRFQDENGVDFILDIDTTLAGGASPPATCATIGEIGNIAFGTDLTLVEDIIGVTYAAVWTAFSGGADAEDEETFRSRLLQIMQNPPMGGSRDDYEIWARGVDGIENAWCFPQTPNAGSATVLVKSSYTDPVPTSELKDAVLAQLDIVKPVTADVYIEGIIPVEIRMSIAIFPKEISLQNEIIANVRDLFLSDAKPADNLYKYPLYSLNLDYAIYISKLRDAIANSGVQNYSILSMSKNIDGAGWNSISASSDITLNGFQYPLLSTITFS